MVICRALSTPIPALLTSFSNFSKELIISWDLIRALAIKLLTFLKTILSLLPDTKAFVSANTLKIFKPNFCISPITLFPNFHHLSADLLVSWSLRVSHQEFW